jgi:hypothetical protein
MRHVIWSTSVARSWRGSLVKYSHWRVRDCLVRGSPDRCRLHRPLLGRGSGGNQSTSNSTNFQYHCVASTYTRQVIKGMFDWVSMMDVTWSFLILEMSSFHIVFDWNDENEVWIHPLSYLVREISDVIIFSYGYVRLLITYKIWSIYN